MSKSITGNLFLRNVGSYELTRVSLIWNARKPSLKPDAIVQAKDVSDVQAAVHFAKANNLKVSIRGRGHHASAPSMRNDGILIDISMLNSIDVDSANKTASVEAAALGGNITQVLSEHDLAFPIGHCPTVPLSGFLLGGGLGWNSGAWGVACSNVTAVDVVTADGDLIHADATHNTDYYWAARGGGAGFFGIAVRYNIRLYSLPTHIHQRSISYPIESASMVSRWLDEATSELPAKVEISAFLQQSETDSGERRHVLSITATAFAHSKEEARDCLAPFDKAPPSKLGPASDTETSFTALSSLPSSGGAMPAGLPRSAEDAFFTDSAPSKYIEKICKWAQKSPSPQSLILLAFRPGPIPDREKEDMIYSMTASTFVAVYSVWSESKHDAENIRWGRQTVAAMKEHTSGYYVNESDITLSEERHKQSFSAVNWQRLQTLIRKHDPDGRFHYFPATTV
ncbi:FAD-binding oxidoreductase [Pelagicoccus mobilis]|uniref:FAD-dependent oxidoreductase n=1 Tax=Pelagicoccus mobilis TaxID=415221 RepID=A0A934VSB2_9BACT|nr:FAD-dependent oxidoreductase [Pelagicoccus mobilis]MBK1878825.1 FAD-dependent oxidoreductase [Pelagicoccus mobilis]